MLKPVDEAMGNGRFLAAHDKAMNGLKQHPGDIWLKHRAVLSLARTGNTKRAIKLFDEFFPLNFDAPDRFTMIEIGSLKARLQKDLGLNASGNTTFQHFAASAQAYQEVFEATTDIYPGINAASLWLWANDKMKAQEVARKCLACEAKNDYYDLISRAEAHLVLEDVAQAEVMLAEALHKSPTVDKRASAYKQLVRVCDCLSINKIILQSLRPGPVLRYLGHMPWAELDDALEQLLLRAGSVQIADMKPDAAYGSLAAGADILLAEAIIKQGIELNLILPFSVESFIEVSVAPFGHHWVERFKRCLEAASSLKFSCETDQLFDATVFQYCSLFTMGVVEMEARNIGAEPVQLAIWDENAASKPGGTTYDIHLWENTENSQVLISKAGNTFELAHTKQETKLSDQTTDGREIRAVLFGDFSGFSGLRELDLKVFYEEILSVIATEIHPFQNSILSKNTWGDGLFIVFEDVASAGNTAHAISSAISNHLTTENAALKNLQLRLGLHAAPMTRIIDPITELMTFVGSEISRAARVEPVTPPGTIFVTEAFAAIAAQEEKINFRCEYMGQVKLAKSAGINPIFRLVGSENG